MTPAEAVVLAGEIVSPWTASADKVLKMHYYAVAGIPWYLLVEQETGALHLYRLKDQHYVEHSVTPSGETLHLDEPVKASIDTAELLPPR